MIPDQSHTQPILIGSTSSTEAHTKPSSTDQTQTKSNLIREQHHSENPCTEKGQSNLTGKQQTHPSGKKNYYRPNPFYRETGIQQPNPKLKRETRTSQKPPDIRSGTDQTQPVPNSYTALSNMMRKKGKAQNKPGIETASTKTILR